MPLRFAATACPASWIAFCRIEIAANSGKAAGENIIRSSAPSGCDCVQANPSAIFAAIIQMITVESVNNLPATGDKWAAIGSAQAMVRTQSSNDRRYRDLVVIPRDSPNLHLFQRTRLFAPFVLCYSSRSTAFPLAGYQGHLPLR
jgi:hypothetical protein